MYDISDESTDWIMLLPASDTEIAMVPKLTLNEAIKVAFNDLAHEMPEDEKEKSAVRVKHKCRDKGVVGFYVLTVGGYMRTKIVNKAILLAEMHNQIEEDSKPLDVTPYIENYDEVAAIHGTKLERLQEKGLL